MTAIAGLAGASVAAGLLLALSGLRRTPPRATAASRRRLKLDGRRVVLALTAGLGALVVTRWPVAALGAAAATYVVSGRRRGRSAAKTIEHTDAIAMWTEMLRDATGTPRGIEGILVATAQDAPEAIRPAVVGFARRLAYEDIETALPSLAEELDHEVGDLVVTALEIAATAGGRQIRRVLDDLAGSARQQASMLRRQEVARERPRAEMRQVAGFSLAVVVAMSVALRDYLEPYDSPVGQLVLVIVAALWVAGFWAMSRLARPERVERFLVAARGDR